MAYNRTRPGRKFRGENVIFKNWLNYAILVSLVLLEKRDLENLLLAPQPTWHQKCCATKATTGLWTCGAQGSLFMCLFLEHFLLTRMKIFMNRFKMHLLCILHIHGRKSLAKLLI